MIPLIEDLEKKITDIKIEVGEIDKIIHPSKEKLHTLIIEQIETLDNLRLYYPHLYKYPQNSIFNAIIEDYKRRAISRTTLNMIYDICSYPQFDKYKHRFYKKDARTPDLKDYQAQGEKQIVDSQVTNTLLFMDSNLDHPSIQSWLQRQLVAQQMQEAEQRKRIQEADKITIKQPAFLNGEPGRSSLLSDALFALEKTIHDCAVRVWRYPPEKIEDDEYYARGIRALNQIFIPGSDLKYVRDFRSYIEIVHEMIDQSIHSAMSHSKIDTAITGEPRKMTREQIADIYLRYVKILLEMLEGIPGIPEFCDYLLRYQKTYGAQFHADRHEKLSESAFGSSIGQI